MEHWYLASHWNKYNFRVAKVGRQIQAAVQRSGHIKTILESPKIGWIMLRGKKTESFLVGLCRMNDVTKRIKLIRRLLLSNSLCYFDKSCHFYQRLTQRRKRSLRVRKQSMSVSGNFWRHSWFLETLRLMEAPAADCRRHSIPAPHHFPLVILDFSLAG